MVRVEYFNVQITLHVRIVVAFLASVLGVIIAADIVLTSSSMPMYFVVILAHVF